MGKEEIALLWGGWLRDQLDALGWRPADLVRASDGNLKADRVSKWLAGKERPSHRYVLIAANSLGASQAEALDVAGYDPVGAAKAADLFARVQAESRVAQGRLEGFASRDLLLELLRRTRTDVGAPDDTSLIDPFGYVTQGELEKRNLGLAAHLGRDVTDQTAVDELPDQETDSDDDARPRA